MHVLYVDLDHRSGVLLIRYVRNEDEKVGGISFIRFALLPSLSCCMNLKLDSLSCFAVVSIILVVSVAVASGRA